jgi:polysaccharide biosynthesis transport protein
MQEPAQADVVYDLGHYTRPIRRHKALIAVCVVIGAALGVLGASAVHPTYSATAKVLVLTDITNQGAGNQQNGRTSTDVNLDTEAQIAKSQQVATIAWHSIHPTASSSFVVPPADLASLTKRLTITVPANTVVLAMNFTASSPGAAQNGANAFADAYLKNRGAVAHQNLQDSITGVREQITKAQAKLVTANATVEAAPASSAAETTAKQNQASLQSQITALNLQLNTLTTAQITPGRTIAFATSGVEEKLKRELVVISGLLLGLLVGIFAAFLKDRTGRTVRNSDDVLEAGLSTVADNSRRPRRAGGPSTLRAEHAAAAVLSSTVGRAGVIYVSGVSSSSASARLGRRIADQLRQFGSTTLIFALTPENGRFRDSSKAFLTNVPATDETTAVLTVTGLNGASLREQIEANRDRADYLVLVGNDAERDSEAFILGSAADATVIVAEVGVTTRRGLRAVVEELALTSTKVVGAVIVRAERPAPMTDMGSPLRPYRPPVSFSPDEERKPAAAPVAAATQSAAPATAPAAAPTPDPERVLDGPPARLE